MTGSAASQPEPSKARTISCSVPINPTLSGSPGMPWVVRVVLGVADHEIEANLDHVARASVGSLLLVLFPGIVRVLSRSLCCSLARQCTTVLISVLFDDQWRDRVDVCLLSPTGWHTAASAPGPVSPKPTLA